MKKSTSFVGSIWTVLCWIHFCRMPSCKWHRFSTNRKIHNGRHRTSSIRIFCHFHKQSLVWSPWYIEICLGCIALVIWDMTTNNRTRYVIERSWVRAPSGVCYFPPHKMSTVSRAFVCQPLQTHTHTHIYIYMIYIWCMVLVVWHMAINGIQNGHKFYK